MKTITLGMVAVSASIFAPLGDVSAQEIVPSIAWEQLYHDSACSFGSVGQTGDGGYILGGRIYDIADEPEQNDCILVKIGSQGELEWEQMYGGTRNEGIRSLRRTADGGYVFVATSDSPRSGTKQAPHFGMEDVWVVKVDPRGIKQWERSIGGSGNDSAASIWQTMGGEYIVAGSSPGPFTVPTLWVIKINAQGEREWIRYLGEKISHFLVSIIQTTDGGYALAGSSFWPSGTGGAPHFGGSDGWLMKVDAEGNKQWEQFFGGTDDEIFLSIDQSADGGFILGGRSSSPPSGNKASPHFGGFDYWVVKVDAAGNQQWEQSYGTAAVNVEEVNVIRQTSDKGYVLGGNSRLIKVDAQGSQQWEQVFASDDPQDAYMVEIGDLRETKEGGYIVCGSYHSSNQGIPAFGCAQSSWVAKLENVVARAGEVLTWKADAGVVLESVEDLKGEWKADESGVLSLGGANAIPLIHNRPQCFYRLRTTGTSTNSPSLSFGALLSWPTNANQRLEFSSAKDGPWTAFSGDHGRIEDTHYAIIPQNLKNHYFRARAIE